MKLRRICACAVAVLCILCSGCTEHMSAEDIEDIQPMTKREFELAYTETLKSQLYDKYKEYNKGDNVVSYEIMRDNNKVSGTFFDINGITVVEKDDNYYFDYNNGVYKVADNIEEVNNISINEPNVLNTIIYNIDKTIIKEVSNNVEIHKSKLGVDEILKQSSTVDGNRTEITVTFLKNFIHIEMYDANTKKKTIINVSFSAPDAIQHSTVGKINTFLKENGTDIDNQSNKDDLEDTGGVENDKE